jgi:carbamoyl-phosphate synthase/aspartate carbamoyltransferase/dihydroorotase
VQPEVARTITVPALLDPHVHLRGMEWSHKGTFASETAAALAGGYWAVLDMPNTLPSTVTTSALERKLYEIGEQAVCDWGVYFGAGQVADAATYQAVIGRVCGLKMYNNATTGELIIQDQSLREAHYRAWLPRRPIAVHAEAETVLDILALVRKHRVPTHFCHICLAEEIDYLQAAKEEGLPVTIGVTPHHLYLTERDLAALGSLGLMKPTLKTEADCTRLWQAITSGIVDVVESDHAPHTLAEKAAAHPPYGVPGLETTLPLMCLAVREGRVTLEHMIDLVANTPRRIFGFSPPRDTYTTIDLDAEYIIERGNLHTACGWTPFEGMRVVGKVTGVRIRGQQVYDGENILAQPGFGINVCEDIP